jgi:tetratricopeptide (TPR) repeat protein
MASQSYKSHVAGLITAGLAALTGTLTLILSASANEEADFNWALDQACQISAGDRDQQARVQALSDINNINQAKSLEKSDSLGAALRYLQGADAKAPSALLSLTIGRYLDRQDKDDAAITEYSKAIQLGATNKSQEMIAGVAQRARADKYAEQGKNDKAIADLNEFISKCRRQAPRRVGQEKALQYYAIVELRATLLLTSLYLAVKDYKSALTASEQFIKSHPDMSDGYQNKARSLQGMGKQQQAIAYMKEAIARGANPRVLDDMKLSTQGNSYEESYKTLTEAIKTSKDPYTARQQRAELARKNHHLIEAMADYQTLLKTAPDDDELLVGRGYTYLEMHKYREAIQDFSKVITGNRDNATSAYKGRSAAYSALNDTVNAKRDLLKSQQ